MIVQQSSINASLVNIILKPIEGLKIPFRPVKYFIYRGLLKSSFISGTAIIPPSPSNSEFIANFWTNWNNFKSNTNQPTLIDPTPASFGYDTTLPSTLEIEKIFDNSQTDARATVVKEGDWIGDFGTIDKIGFEIIFSNDSFLLDLEYLKSNDFQIEVSAFTVFELKAKREQILSFIDPAAFFGLHYESGVNISIFSGNTKTVSILKRNDIYSLLLDKFKTKNRVYLDIRSEKGYSYNFYVNYDDGSANNIKIGNSTLAPTAQNYSTNEWPIIFIDIPITTTKNENDIKINLRIDDNTKPILFFENSELLEGNRNTRFLSENEILNGTAIDWSKDLTFKFPNTGTNTKENIAFYVKLQYFRQIDDANMNPLTVSLRAQSNMTTIFASLDTQNLGNTDFKFQQVSNEHFSFVEGALSNGKLFSGIAVPQANFDENRIILHTQMLFPRKTTGYSYLQTDAEINEGFSLEGNFNQMSFLKKDIYSYSQSIQENSTSPPIKLLDIAAWNGFTANQEDLFILGLMQTELLALKSVTGLSSLHARYIGFEDVSPSPAVDINGIPYKKYKLNVQGLNAIGVVTTLNPSSDIFVFTSRGLVFASKAFADAEPNKEDNIEYIYYTQDGIYVGGDVDSNKVYIATQQEYNTAKQSQKWYLINQEIKLLKEKNIPISHVMFVKKSSTIYGESSAAYGVIEQFEFYAIASVHKRNNVAFGVGSDFAITFRKTSCANRNNIIGMKFSIAAEINALIDGFDHSYGAKQWDGAEQTHLPLNNLDTLSEKKIMYKINVMGWDIKTVHYNSWKNAVNQRFGSNYFNAPQKKYAVANYGGMKNKDKIRLQSFAQYALTMLWKEVNISKP